MTRTLLLASAAIGLSMISPGGAGAADYAKPFNWSGFYVGLHAGWLNGDVTVHEELELTPGGNISGSVFGALAGYTFPYSPVAPWTLGVEADLGWADVHGRGIEGPPIFDCNADYLYDLNWDAHLRLRAGLPMGTLTPFLAAGIAVADLNIRETCGGPSDLGGIYTGGTIGAGLDLNASPNMMVRGEVLYDFYGRKQYDDFSADFTAWTGRVAVVWRLP
jgi:outer membrane immunogenic protein